MGLGAVQHHVAYRIALVDEYVEIGQRAYHCACQGSLPHRSVPAHDCGTDRCPQGRLCNGIQTTSPYTLATLRPLRPVRRINRLGRIMTPSLHRDPRVNSPKLLRITLVQESGGQRPV